MEPQYIFVYVAANVFCMFVALVILSRINYNVGTEHENHYFRGMVLCFIGFVLFELLWILGTGGIMPLPPKIASFFKAASTLLIPLMVYFWFWFAEIKFRSGLVHNWVARIVTTIPIVGLIICYLVSIFNGMVFALDADGSLVPGPLVGLTGLVNNIYGIAIIAHALVLLVKEKVPYRRHEYSIQVFFIVLCTAGGLIDAVFTNTPLMPLAIALAFIYLFANLQENQIYNDALTGLNNRRRADQFIIDSIAVASEQFPLYVFVLDVNNFKEINDSLGHLEGDRALQAVARSIDAAADEYNGFAARWGGDEFIVAASGGSPSLSEDLQESIHEKIAAAARNLELPYTLSASIGVARCDTNTTKLSDLIAKADAALYEQKRQKKTPFDLVSPQ